MSHPLLTGQLVRLAAMNPETDAEFFARWDRDTEYVRLLDEQPLRLTVAKKIKENIEKELDEHAADGVLFSIRTLAEDQLIGFIGLDGIRWAHGDTFVAIGIGDAAYRGHGYGTDAMRVMLRYAFSELNLRRVSLDVFEYNEHAIRSYQKAGFEIEGCQRQALLRSGRRWDLIYMGILQDEWSKRIEQ